MFGIFESVAKAVTTVAADVVNGAAQVAEAGAHVVVATVDAGIELVKEVRDEIKEATK